MFQDYLLYIIHFTTLLSCVLLPFQRYNYFKYLRSIKTEGFFFMQSNEMKILIIQLLVILIQPFKFLENYNYFNRNYEENIFTIYNANHFMILLMLGRFILMVNILFKNLQYSSIRMNTILFRQRMEEKTIFVVKCMMKDKPYSFFIYTLLISIMLFTFSIRICELPLAIRLEDESF